MFRRGLGDTTPPHVATARGAASVPATAMPAANPGIHYTFAIPPIVLAGNQQNYAASQQITDYDFEGHFLVCQSTGAFLAQFQIGSTRWLSNVPIHSANLFGTGQAPLPFIVPLKLRQGDLLSVTLSDLSGAQNTIYIGIHGRQLV